METTIFQDGDDRGRENMVRKNKSFLLINIHRTCLNSQNTKARAK